MVGSESGYSCCSAGNKRQIYRVNKKKSEFPMVVLDGNLFLVGKKSGYSCCSAGTNSIKKKP
jgi:hypothetical protein